MELLILFGLMFIIVFLSLGTKQKKQPEKKKEPKSISPYNYFIVDKSDEYIGPYKDWIAEYDGQLELKCKKEPSSKFAIYGNDKYKLGYISEKHLTKLSTKYDLTKDVKFVLKEHSLKDDNKSVEIKYDIEA